MSHQKILSLLSVVLCLLMNTTMTWAGDIQPTNNANENSIQKSESWHQNLEQNFNAWAQQMGQSYSNYYPNNSEDFSHANLSLSELLANLTVNGEEVSIALDSENQNEVDYIVHSIYSTYQPSNPEARLITYLIVSHNDQLQVLVSEQTDSTRKIDFHQTKNIELGHLVEALPNSNSVVPSPKEDSSTTYNLAQLFQDRDQTFSPAEAEKYLRATMDSVVPPETPMIPDASYQFPPKEPGYMYHAYFTRIGEGAYNYRVSQGTGAKGPDIFLSQGYLVAVIWYMGPTGTVCLLDPETYQELDNFEINYSEFEAYLNLTWK